MKVFLGNGLVLGLGQKGLTTVKVKLFGAEAILLESGIIMRGSRVEYARCLLAAFSALSIVIGFFPFIRYRIGSFGLGRLILETLAGDLFVLVPTLAFAFYAGKKLGVWVCFLTKSGGDR